MNYKRCSDVTDHQIFEAFSGGFSDYIIKFKMDEDFFIEHFFGPEGNRRDLSWLALDGETPVGLVLGGIRPFDGLKTMRCGTMCVIPAYRNRHIATALLDKHRETAREQGCDQLFLECIEGNDKALAFYRKEGYETRHYLHYFVCKNPYDLEFASPDEELKVEKLTMDEVKKLRKDSAVHWNWQNEMEYLEYNRAELTGIRANGRAVAALAFREERIQFLYVSQPFRGKGLARMLVSHAAKERDKMTVSFPDNDSLPGFYERAGFTREPIRQQEMYRSLV